MKSALALKDRSRAVAAAAAPVTFSVPLADLTEFSTLPKARRTEVQFTLCVLEQLRRAIPQAARLCAARRVATTLPYHLASLIKI